MLLIPTETPVGLCECGCGEPAPISAYSDRTKGYRKGQPRRFVSGHNGRDLREAYVVDPVTGCWVWQRKLNVHGYGVLRRYGRHFMAHRFFYEQTRGATDLGLDHLCHTRDLDCPGGASCLHRRCVNPDHLEPVTTQVNVRRGRWTKLTAEIVSEIRRSTTHPAVLAKQYGVTPGHIANLRCGIAWKDVT